MIQEAYVSFETAKLLKDKGFDESCRYYYVNNGNLMFTEEYFHNSEIKYGTYTGCICTAPTLQMAMKWLREVHTLFIEITVDLSDVVYPMYNAKIVNLKTCDNHYVLGYDRYSYEEAVETAIINCLNLI